MYKTKQKEILVDFFSKNTSKQYSIKEITDSITNKGIGKSTIYRLIDKMTEEGSIRRFRGNDGKSVLYQYTGQYNECNSHFHLKCTSCGLLIHLNCEYMTSLNNHINEHHNFNVDTGKTILYGICSECKERNLKIWIKQKK